MPDGSDLGRRQLLAGGALLLLEAALARSVHAQPAPDWTTRRVRNAGLTIVYHVAGTGPVLIIVHGGASTSAAYRGVADRLTDRFTVVLVERRNYLISGSEPPPHSYARQGDDIAAVAQAVGEPAFLFGHSAGALASMYAVRRHPRTFRATVLYEPPLSAGGPGVHKIVGEMHRQLAAGDIDGALVTGFRDVVGLPDADARATVSAGAAGFRPIVRGAMADIEALEGVDTDPRHWTALAREPLLLLIGSKSPQHPLRDSSLELAAALPKAQVVSLEGQGHSACVLAPAMVADQLARFFAP